MKSDAIIIENDEKYNAIDGFGVKRKIEDVTKGDILTYIKDAGIVGMGGAGFPTHVKLAPKNSEAIEQVIVNGAECEPYLTSDYRMMLEEPEKIIQGLCVVLKLFPNARGIIAIEDNKMDCVQTLQELTKDYDNITVCILKTKYPQGAERQLIYAATGKKINSSMLPADAGVVVNNVDTIVSIYYAVLESTPLIRRILTITGDAFMNVGNYNVKTGMSYKEIIDEVGGFKEQPEKVISGGPMMGLALFELDIPVTKTSSALLAFSKDEAAKLEPSACIRCGRCIGVCPSHLVPQKMLEYAERFDDEGFKEMHGMECYECGCCTYVCPAKRRLTQSFKQTRRSILSKR